MAAVVMSEFRHMTTSFLSTMQTLGISVIVTSVQSQDGSNLMIVVHYPVETIYNHSIQCT